MFSAGWRRYETRRVFIHQWVALLLVVRRAVAASGPPGGGSTGAGLRYPWPLPLQPFDFQPCNWTPSGSGTSPSRRTWIRRLPDYVHKREHFQEYLEEWETIQGFIAAESVFYMHLVTALQHELGVLGAVGEIGVATGLSVMGMALARRGNESLVAVDMFDLKGKEQRNAGDDMDGQRMRMFAENLLSIGIDMRVKTETLFVHEGNSLELSDLDLVRMSGGRGFRMFHVDGAHFAREAFHDLCSVACSLTRGGVLLLDDVFSAGWLGVGEAFHRFMHMQGWLRESSALSLEPFLYAGRLYMAEAAYAAAYRSLLRSALQGAGGRRVFASKYLYGSEILCAADTELHLLGAAKKRLTALAREKLLGVTDKVAAEKMRQRLEWGEAMLALRLS